LEPSRRTGKWGLAILAAAVTPALAAVWIVPWFVTQDGPAHVYNAQVLAWSFDPASPFREIYTIRWRPIPNWVGHLALASLVAVLPAWVADRIMTSVTLVGFAAAVFWLRRRVAGRRHLPASACLAALLAMNITWLFGFTSFLLGACLFAVTLGFWWPHRDDLPARRIAGLASLLVLGYFCHPVSLGLTAVGLIVLALASPLPPGTGARPARQRLTRLVPLGASLLALVPLGLCYLRLTPLGGPIRPLWENLADPFSLGAWKVQVGWVDPLTLARKDVLPFTERVSRAFIVLAPAAWLAVGLLIWGLAEVSTRWPGRARGRFARPPRAESGQPEVPAPAAAAAAAPERRGWLLLAALLIAGGMVGPDTLGSGHGEYLPQRVVLCGLVALVPVVDIDLRSRTGRAAAAALVGAVALQSTIVWDYAVYSDQTAGAIVRAVEEVGRNRRVVALPAAIRSRFRANPLLHAGNWLGVDSGNVVWNNYETRHYYFPVQFVPGIDRPGPDELEDVVKRDDPGEALSRSRDWERILAHHADAIDVVLVYKGEPRLDAITERWFRLVQRRGEVRIFHRDRDRYLSRPSPRERSSRSS
jgi:hypothetical protein